MYTPKALVQLPDGTFRRCPLAREIENAIPKVVQYETEKGALDWTRFILPGKIEVEKE
jgi:hypothetical protein